MAYAMDSAVGFSPLQIDFWNIRNTPTSNYGLLISFFAWVWGGNKWCNNEVAIKWEQKCCKRIKPCWTYRVYKVHIYLTEKEGSAAQNTYHKSINDYGTEEHIKMSNFLRMGFQATSYYTKRLLHQWEPTFSGCNLSPGIAPSLNPCTLCTVKLSSHCRSYSHCSSKTGSNNIVLLPSCKLSILKLY